MSTSVKLSWWLMNRVQRFLRVAWPNAISKPMQSRGVVSHAPDHLVKEVMGATRCSQRVAAACLTASGMDLSKAVAAAMTAKTKTGSSCTDSGESIDIDDDCGFKATLPRSTSLPLGPDRERHLAIATLTQVRAGSAFVLCRLLLLYRDIVCRPPRRGRGGVCEKLETPTRAMI